MSYAGITITSTDPADVAAHPCQYDSEGQACLDWKWRQYHKVPRARHEFFVSDVMPQMPVSAFVDGMKPGLAKRAATSVQHMLWYGLLFGVPFSLLSYAGGRILKDAKTGLEYGTYTFITTMFATGVYGAKLARSEEEETP